MKSLFLVGLFCFICPFIVNGQTIVYKTVHADGTVTFSDKPSPGAIEVILGDSTTVIPSSPVPKIEPDVAVKKKQFNLTIVSPKQEATLRDNSGNFSIQAQLKPSIGGMYNLTINGQSFQSPSGVFQLENMDRGEYSYKVDFTDNSGKIIASSEQRTLFLHRASVLIPRN
ncbi:DUF4124 domain-containing protein [Glaciecola sp. 1036]|uniref:DUF4124 domain-containing protein n=1 Tax=Alteromonadaceae TaxID=72275 RepID=UPI003D037130